MSGNRREIRIAGKLTPIPAAPRPELMHSPASWREAVAMFVAGQDIKQSSRNLYARTLSQFFFWIRKTGRSIGELTREDVLEYKDHLQEAGLSPLTVGSYIEAVRMFYAWAESQKLYPNIANGVKTPKRVQQFKKQHLKDYQASALLEHFAGRSVRDYAIITLLLRTGIRTVELVRADVGDITIRDGRRVLKVWGKGRDSKDDFVVLSDKTYAPIADYIAKCRRTARAGEPLFISASRHNMGQRLTTRSISRICKEGLRAVGLDSHEYTAHSLRHTTAVAILQHGGTIADAQDVLRHVSSDTTSIYLESIKDEARLDRAPELIIDKAF